jgi:hypothetical protein
MPAMHLNAHDLNAVTAYLAPALFNNADEIERCLEVTKHLI